MLLARVSGKRGGRDLVQLRECSVDIYDSSRERSYEKHENFSEGMHGENYSDSRSAY